VTPGDEWPANFARSRNLTGVSGEENQNTSASPFLERGFHDIGRFGRLRFTAGSEAPTSMIRNGQFREQDRQGRPLKWNHSAENADLVTVDDRIFRIGGQSLRIQGRAGGTVQVTQGLPDLKPNTEYLLTFFMKSEQVEGEGKAVGAVVNVWTHQNEWFPATWQTGDLPWQKLGFLIQTGPDVNSKPKSYIALRLSGSGVVWFDDVMIREVVALSGHPSSESKPGQP
jgi:hypothetical protein